MNNLTLGQITNFRPSHLWIENIKFKDAVGWRESEQRRDTGVKAIYCIEDDTAIRNTRFIGFKIIKAGTDLNIMLCFYFYDRPSWYFFHNTLPLKDNDDISKAIVKILKEMPEDIDYRPELFPMDKLEEYLIQKLSKGN